MNEDREHHEGDAHDARTPCVLLVEDDAVSAAFLGEAIAAVPAKVAITATVAEALRIAATRTFDLWLIDAHLPDGYGADLLARLRAQGHRAPALAHTAETANPVLDRLIDAGFEEVLIKPLGVAAVQGAIRRFTGSANAAQHPAHAAASPAAHADFEDDRERPTCGKLPLWNDDAALRALNGNRTHVMLMRRLFRAELPQQAERIVAAQRIGDTQALSAELHKLLASSGFVGAARLGDTARALQTTPDDERAFRRFEAAMQDTLASPDGD